METPRERTTVTMPSSGDVPRVIEQQQSHALNTTLAGPNVTRRQMLTASATTGIALAPVAVQARATALPDLPTFFLKVGDFIQSLVQIPAAPVNFNKFNPGSRLKNTTTATQYLSGITDMYFSDGFSGQPVGPVGRCSASFLCFQVPSAPNSPNPRQPRFYTDIANYISLDNGLIVSWFTPTTLADLGLDSLINGMVTECIVVASTKIGANPFYGQTFNLKVFSSVSLEGEQQVSFTFTNLAT